MAYRVLLVGGGTGGHVYPLMAVANSLRSRAQKVGLDLELMAMGEGDFLRSAVAENQIKHKSILAGKFRRYLSPLTILDIIKIPIGFIQSLWHIFWYMPDVIFSKGGYASLAPSFVGWLNFIPVYIHESDAIPGLANRIISKFAKKVFISFPGAEKYFKPGKTILTGNPVRPELFDGEKDLALRSFDLSNDKKTVFVFGGSQGAKAINDLILASLVMLVRQYQVIHQCGNGQYPAVKAEVNKITNEGKGHYDNLINERYRSYPFLNVEQLKMAYAACDVLVSRAGAANLFEIAALGKPAIVIPITKSTSNHQMKNAEEFAKFGGILLKEENLTTHILLNQIDILLNPENYAKVSEEVKKFATPEAANKIADILLESKS